MAAPFLKVREALLDPDELRTHILALFPIGRAAHCRLHARGLNDTYRVETAGGDVFFLRVYRHAWRTPTEIDSELRLLAHLARCGAGVAAPVATRDGEEMVTVACAEGERHAALFTAAPGRLVINKDYSEEQARLYGAAVADIHIASDSFADQLDRPELDMNALLERPLALLLDALSRRPDDRAFVASLAECLRADAAGPLEYAICHGDPHGGNAELEGERFTFYDFDFCGRGFRAYELAIFPWAFAINDGVAERVETMGRAYLAGYRSRRSIGERDIAAIPAFVAIREIWLMGLHVSLGDRFGHAFMNDRYFDHHMKMLRAWESGFLSRPITEWIEAKET